MLFQHKREMVWKPTDVTVYNVGASDFLLFIHSH